MHQQGSDLDLGHMLVQHTQEEVRVGVSAGQPPINVPAGAAVNTSLICRKRAKKKKKKNKKPDAYKRRPDLWLPETEGRGTGLEQVVRGTDSLLS